MPQEETKEAIRRLLPAGLADPLSKIRATVVRERVLHERVGMCHIYVLYQIVSHLLGICHFSCCLMGLA